METGPARLDHSRSQINMKDHHVAQAKDLSVSLWHEGGFHAWKESIVGALMHRDKGFGCLELCLYGIRELTSAKLRT